MKTGFPLLGRQPWFWAALLLPLAFGLAQWTQFHSRVRVIIDANQVKVLINGTELSIPLRDALITELTAIVAQPFEQFGGGGMSIRQPGKAKAHAAFPARWKFPDSTRPPGGDWWIDSVVGEKELITIGYLRGVWRAPFTVDIDIPGRISRPFTLRFNGPTRFEVSIRYGLINNDASIYIPESPYRVVTAPVGGMPAFDGLHLCGTLAKALCLGCLLILGATAVSVLDRSVVSPLPNPALRSSVRWLTGAVLGLAVLRFAISWWVADELLNRLPHFQDDLCYILRAKWLLAGALDQPIPPFAEQFQLPFTSYFKNRWLTPYPIMWSAMLAAGMKLGAAWLVSPVCGACAIFFIYRLGVRIANGWVGAIAALFLALSPFAIIVSGSLLNHSATSMFLVLFACLFVEAWSENREIKFPCLLISGIALGCAFGIRPLTAAAMGLPTLFLGLYEWKRRGFGLKAFGGLVVFAAGVGIGSLPTLWDNATVTGSPFLFAYRYLNTERALPELLPTGLFWSDHSLGQLPMLMTGWGWPWLRGDWWLYLPYGFAAVPFLTGRANRNDWWLLGLFLSVIVAHFSHAYNTMHGFGPRIYLDPLFAVFVLMARGCSVLTELPHPFRSSPGRGLVVRCGVSGVVVALCASTAFTLRERLERYRGYNDVDDQTSRLIDQIGVPRALVLLRPDSMLKWIRLANHLLPDPTAGNIVFAAMQENNDAIIAAFGRDRPVYILEDRTLIPYSPSK